MHAAMTSKHQNELVGYDHRLDRKVASFNDDLRYAGASTCRTPDSPNEGGTPPSTTSRIHRRTADYNRS